MRSILYAVIPHFYALLTLRAHPDTSGYPLMLAEKDLVVDTCPEAFQWGVRPGMSLRRARQTCPGVIVRPFAQDEFSREIAALRDAAASLTPVVEPDGASSLYLDLTGCGDALDLARRFGLAAYACIGVPLQLGLASSKLVAKAAAALPASRHSQGFSLSHISPGREGEVLSDLPVAALPLDEATVARLTHLGLLTVGEVAAVPDTALLRQLGPLARQVSALSRGTDTRRVLALYPPSCLEAIKAFPDGTSDPLDLQLAVTELCASMERQLGHNNRVAGRLVLAVETVSRTFNIGIWLKTDPAVQDGSFGRMAQRLLNGFATAEPVLRLTLRAEQLAIAAGRQLTMFHSGAPARRPALEGTLRSVRQRYGNQSVVSGCSVPTPRREKLLNLFLFG